jgi:hypothetical protein
MIANGISLKNSPRKIFTYKGCRMKRIKELAKDHLLQDKYDADGQVIEGDYYEFDPQELQDFVQLIVKECINYCGDNLSKTVGGALKIHFGIGEKE